MVSVGEVLWQPSQAWVENTNVHHFRRWLQQRRQREFTDLHALYRWSVAEIDEFWGALWDFFQIQASTPPTQVLGRREMPGAQWFPGARLNYAEHILRHERPGHSALLYCSEQSPLQAMDWREFGAMVRKLATRLRELGVKPGDRVAAYMSNTPEAVIALLATSSIGAIWSSCSPDFGAHSVLDRLSQIEPRVLFCVDGYHYKGKAFSRKQELCDIIAALPSLDTIIYLPHLHPDDATLPMPGA
ncbi:MAG: AMP-binding protein, partial [Pseudomonadales bacterium]|nr:AMP-binding protein [Pseudomonadales bacterium]